MGTRTPLMSRPHVGGNFAYADIAGHTGCIWFVGSTVTGATDAVGYGRDPDKPFATLDYVNSQATAHAGDVVYLLPGHVEVVAGAAGLVMDCAGLHVIGCGNGTYQPIIRLTLAAADIDIDAANVTFENVNFQAGAADVIAAIDVNATDFTIRKCRFTEQTAALNALIWIQDAGGAGSDRITVEDCLVYAPDTANTHFINFAGTGTGHVIRRNCLLGDWGTMAIGGAGIVTECNVSDNYIYNLAVTVNGCINFAATATGVMSGNMVGNSAAANNQIIATGMSKNFNYGVDIAGGDVQGIPEPAMA